MMRTATILLLFAAALPGQDPLAELRHPESQTRIDTLKRLGAEAAKDIEGARAEVLVHAVLPLLFDGQSPVRQAAARTLGQLRPDLDEECVRLTHLLGPASIPNGARKVVIMRWGGGLQMDPSGWRERLASESAKARAAALRVLSALPAKNWPADLGAAVRALVVTDPSPVVRAEGAQALAVLAASDPEARHALQRVVQDPDPEVREQALLGLGRAPAADGISRGMLLASTRDRKPRVRRAAFRGLAWMKTTDPKVRARALLALEDKDFDVVLEVVAYLATQGEAAARAAPRARVLLADDSHRMRAAALRLLSHCLPDDPSTVLAMVAGLGDAKKHVRNAAEQEFLRRIGRPGNK